MELTPVPTQSRPAYPAHRRRGTDLRAWARRLAVAAAASSALWVGGCYGSIPRGDGEGELELEELVLLTDYDYEYLPPVNEEPENTAGGARAPGFQCNEPPDWGYQVPAYLEGRLCGEETSFGQLTNPREQRVTVELYNHQQHVVVAVLGPDGEVLAELSDEAAVAELMLPMGIITFAATGADPEGDPTQSFHVTVDPLD